MVMNVTKRIMTTSQTMFYIPAISDISNQCCSSGHICEFRSEYHATDSCPNKLRSTFCSNCCWNHMDSSRECPVYQYEFGLSSNTIGTAAVLVRWTWVWGNGVLWGRDAQLTWTTITSLWGTLYWLFVILISIWVLLSLFRFRLTPA